VPKKQSKYKGRGLVQVTGRQLGKSTSLVALQRLFRTISGNELRLFKLDKRYTGHEEFKWCVDCMSTQSMINIRNWCWETFGPSDEVDNGTACTPGRVWAWQHTQHVTRIFLKSDAEATLFNLKWV